jgi:hypothetical protein
MFKVIYKYQQRQLLLVKLLPRSLVMKSAMKGADMQILDLH